MRRPPFVQLTLAIVAVFLSLAGQAAAQTRKLTVHTVYAGASGSVRLVAGAFGSCLNPDCTYSVGDGATIRLAADYPGRFSGGTGPAAACDLSTCSVSMTADAEVTATFATANGPSATVTTTMSGDGAGVIRADGARCASGSCSVAYLQGSTVQLAADIGSARFAGYSSTAGPASACGVQPVCTFTLTGNATATATFLALASVTVSPSNVTRASGGPPQDFTTTGTYSGGANIVVHSHSTSGAFNNLAVVRVTIQ